mgnify:CR=1 FL=1
MINKNLLKKIGKLSITAIAVMDTMAFSSAFAMDTDEKSNFDFPSISEIISTMDGNEDCEQIRKEINSLQKKILVLKIKDYVSSRNLDKTQIKELEDSVMECLNFYKKNEELRKSHFGYPANMVLRSPVVDFFRYIEASGFLANNCGDVFEVGNYQMDSKKIEQDILAKFAEKFGMGDKYWGYVTSGGSESNAWAINTAFKKNPDGILYYCEAAHYSISKNAEGRRQQVIPQVSDSSEAINCDILLSEIKKNYEESKAPANIILSWGTTRFGSCDDVKRITDFLISEGIPYYVHVDAAMFGGIPSNQEDAPIITDVNDLHIDSICVSLHKYIGVPVVKSVLLSTGPSYGNMVEYIGQTDSTTCGSRDIMPFSMRQQVIDMLDNSDPKDYISNIKFFEELLSERNIPFIRDGKSNTFVINAPSEEICKKYQLSCFSDKSGNPKAHIIIFPYQSREAITNLANDLI